MTTSSHIDDRGLVAVLDDDPTGPQGAADVPVVLRLDSTTVRNAVDAADGGLYLLTNTRSLDPLAARATTHAAAAVVQAAAPDAALVLRGDSTLRGHLLEEYLAVRDVRHPDTWPPLLLVPALPSAGRVTVDGVQQVDVGGVRRPAHETEYAADRAFGYPDAQLLRWAEHRSGGVFKASRGTTVDLATVRSEDGVAAIVRALARAADATDAVAIAPDVETDADLAVVAEAWRDARALGIPVIVRSGPAFATLAAGVGARELVSPPVVERLLVVCGSHVGLATAQLAALRRLVPQAYAEVDAHALADGRAGYRADEIERQAEAAARSLHRHGIAVLATPRVRDDALGSLAAGRLVADGIARIAAAVGDTATGLVVKGGITSATVAADGLGATVARVVGPVEPGVSLWELPRPGGPLPYVVVPGNVGDDETLARLVRRVAAVQR